MTKLRLILAATAAAFAVVSAVGAATSANVELINRNLAWHGNDFSLDDISFSGAAAPEPSMWLVTIMGFGAAGAMLARRRLVPVRAA